MKVAYRYKTYSIYRPITEHSLQGIIVKPEEFILVKGSEAVVIRGTFVEAGFVTNIGQPNFEHLKDNLRDPRKNEIENIQKLLNKT